MDCTNRGTTEDGFRSIGKLCRVGEEDLEGIKSWLSSRSERWLLVLHNADDTTFDYQEYIPAGRRGNIIPTTRNPDCQGHATVGRETLDQLESEHAMELLFRTVRLPEAEWESKKKAAAGILEALGRQTLAII